MCFVRDSKTLGAFQDVPGCSTNPMELNAKDFCVDASLYTCKDTELPFELVGEDIVAAGDGKKFARCDFVAENTMDRCTMYGIYCRETCGYCRGRNRNKDRDKIGGISRDRVRGDGGYV